MALQALILFTILNLNWSYQASQTRILYWTDSMKFRQSSTPSVITMHSNKPHTDPALSPNIRLNLIYKKTWEKPKLSSYQILKTLFTA